MTTNNGSSSKGKNQVAVGVRALIPSTAWLPRYEFAVLHRDAIAGISLAAYAIPVSMAYASLAGLPPHHGIYCILVAGFAYALLGTSRQLAVGPTSAIAMLVGTNLAEMAGGDPAIWSALAALTALLVSVLALIAWLLRLSGLVSFMSETILIGFKAGAALTIGLTQLPKLLGVKGGGDDFFESAWILITRLGDTNIVVLGVGLAAIALLLLGNKLLPGRPVVLFVVALAIAIMFLTDLNSKGVATVGAIPSGLPKLRWPALHPRHVRGVVPLAAACFLLAYVESISAARALAAKHGYSVDPRQELLALGAANLATAFSQGFPVSGGLSESTVNDTAGARTPLALVFESLATGFCLLFLTGVIRNLPTVVLAAIVLVAVRRLIDVEALRHLWRVSRYEFYISVVALLGVLWLGVLKGVLLAVVVSVIVLVATVARPHVAFLGRIPGTRRFSDSERHPDNESIPGVLIFRTEASLIYFNAEHVRNTVRAKIAATEGLRLVVCDLSNSPIVDVAGAAMLAGLHKELSERSIRLRVVEARAKARDLLRAEGLEDEVGYLGRHMSIDQALAEFADSQ
jgi:high affinity sulfate transporter 1